MLSDAKKQNGNALAALPEFPYFRAFLKIQNFKQNEA